MKANKLNELIFSTSENVLYSAYGYHRDTCNKLFKVMGFFGFLFGLGAAVVVVMLMLGIMFVPDCDESKKKNRTQPKLCCSIGGIRTGIMESDQGRAAEAFSFAKNYKLNFSSLVGPRGPPRNPGLIGPSGKDGVDGRPGNRG